MEEAPGSLWRGKWGVGEGPSVTRKMLSYLCG